MKLSSLLNKTPFHLALIAILGLAAYSNTFNAPFQWDEETFIVNNPIVKDLGYFLHPSKAKVHELYGAFKNRYIGYLTFALNYRLHGLDMRGYHIFNLTVHILNACLVYFLVMLTYKTPSLSGEGRGPSPRPSHPRLIALFSALLFVSHPIQTEAVTYIFQRLASLAAFFYLLSLVLYVKWRLSSLGHYGLSGIFLRKDSRQAGMTARQSIFYLASLLSALLAMKTKENAFTLPVMIALYEFFFFSGPVRRRLIYLIPFILAMLIIPLTLIGVDKPIGEIIGGIGPAMGGSGEISRTDYLFTQFRVIVTYIRLLFLPVKQNIDYDYPVFGSFSNPQVLLSFLFLLSVFGLGAYLLYRSRLRAHLRLASFGIFWFFITLSIESSIISLPMLINEYRVYLPSAGIFSVLTGGLFLLSEKFWGKWGQAVVMLFLAVIAPVFSYATYTRNAVWKSEISLWEDAVRKSPDKARVHFNLGEVYQDTGLTDKAVEHYKTALRLKPDYAEAHNNLGITLAVIGSENAIEHFQTALSLKPDIKGAHFNLGIIQLGNGFPEEARREFEMELRINPEDPEAVLFLLRTSKNLSAPNTKGGHHQPSGDSR